MSAVLHSDPVGGFLDRLDGVKQTAPDKWIARCPAHDDRGPSLSVRDVGDRLLIHCFAGCDALAIVHAVGLELTDLFADRLEQHSYKPTHSRIPARDALATLEHESLVVALIGDDFLKHRSIDDETWARLASSVQRIGDTRAKCEFRR